MPLCTASLGSDDCPGRWIEHAPRSYGRLNVAVSVKHRPPMRSLASRIANFLLEARRRLPAAIPAAPAPMIKTSKSGSRRRPASAGHESEETRPAMVLRRVSLRVFSAGVIDCPAKLAADALATPLSVQRHPKLQ